MSNIFEFPVADRPVTEDEIAKLHAEAFRDLEGRISDCLWMSVIALEMVERAIEGRDDKHEKAMFRRVRSCEEAKAAQGRPITPLGTVKNRWSLSARSAENDRPSGLTRRAAILRIL